MTSKQRVHATLEGRTVDRMPVTVLYNQLYHLDHFAELTGLPQSEMHRWLCAPVEEHLALFRRLVEAAPFEILQPQPAPPREARRPAGLSEPVPAPAGTPLPVSRPATRSGHAHDYRANETQHVFDRQDVRRQVRVRRAEELLAAGANDYVDAAVEAFGSNHFILSGGVVGTLYDCHQHLGLTNLFGLLLDNPGLVEYLSSVLLDATIERIRQLAAAGGDAIYIDDAMSTSDMISPAHYERFCLPHVREMVREVHRLGHKAILIYFGGIADRLEQIVSLGADGLSMETSMKGYINDIEAIAASIGDRVSLFGNIDPVGVLQNAGDEGLKREVAHQVASGRHARGFVICTGSPITPATPLPRVRRFLELGRQYGAAGA